MLQVLQKKKSKNDLYEDSIKVDRTSGNKKQTVQNNTLLFLNNRCI